MDLTKDEMISMLESFGYFDVRFIDGLGYCGLCRYIFTVGVLIGITITKPYDVRFCFNDLLSARSFLNNWDGETWPEIGKDGCTAIK